MNNSPETWTKKLLVDCTKNQQISYGIVQPGKFVEDGVPVVRVNNFNSGVIDTSDLLKVDKAISEKHKKTLLKGGEVLLTIVGSTGQTAIVSDEFYGYNVVRAVAVIDPIEEVGPVWVDIFLQSEQAKYFLNVRANTTVQKTLNLKDVKELPIHLPPKQIKNKIEDIYLTINKKINTNLQINRILEELAQTIFKSWFVDFDPVHAKKLALEKNLSIEQAERAAMAIISGVCSPMEYAENFEEMDKKLFRKLSKMPKDKQDELAYTASLFPSGFVESELEKVPEGWTPKPLGDFLEVKRGGSPRPIRDYIVKSGYPWTKIADATANDNPFIFKTKEFIKEEGLRKTVCLKEGSLILSNSATPGLPRFLAIDACVHDGWLYFPKKEYFSNSYLYFLFLDLKQKFIQQGNGSVFTNLKTDIIRKQKVTLPPEELIASFSKIAFSNLDMIKVLSLENESLKKLSDTLLPKLLTGKIDLFNIKLNDEDSRLA